MLSAAARFGPANFCVIRPWVRLLRRARFFLVISICYHAATRTGQTSPIYTHFRVSRFVVSCGFRLPKVGSSEFRKLQIEQVREPQTGGFARIQTGERIVTTASNQLDLLLA